MIQEQIEAAVMEKRKHIRLTSLCNNNCSFCLAGHITEKFMLGLDDLKQTLIDGIKEGNSRLILSGGEASINKNIFDIIHFAKKLGYKKVQLITNGRMLSDELFVKQLVLAGLDETTFSIHSHIPKVHDELTRVTGSFKHAIKGLFNAKKNGLIVNVDIVLNSKNVKTLRDTILFFNKLGIEEFDLLQITPFGNAFDNMQTLFYDISKNMPYITSAFDLAKERNIVIWTNRFPAKYLEGYEFLIQDSHKILDEVNGRRKMFLDFIDKGIMLSCRDHRCNMCYMQQFCDKLIESVNSEQDSVFEKIVYIDKLNISSIEKRGGNILSKMLISLSPPVSIPSDYKKIALDPTRIIAFFELYNKEISKTDIPPCLSRSNAVYSKNNWNFDGALFKAGKLDLDSFSKEFIKNYKIKAEKCKECAHNDFCEGVYQNYIKIYGFSALTVVRSQ